MREFTTQTKRPTAWVRSQIVLYGESGESLAELLSNFKVHWRSQLGSDTDYVATFLPSDLEWLYKWEELRKSGKCSSQLKEYCDRRLDWEIISELLYTLNYFFLSKS